MTATVDRSVTMPVCYTPRCRAVKKTHSEQPIAAFSNHLLGFRPLFVRWLDNIQDRDGTICCKTLTPFRN